MSTAGYEMAEPTAIRDTKGRPKVTVTPEWEPQLSLCFPYTAGYRCNEASIGEYLQLLSPKEN